MSNRALTRQSLQRVEGQAPAIPLSCAPVLPREQWLPAGQDSLDEETLAYIRAAQPAFDRLRVVSGQFAALLILAAAGGRSAQDNPVFALAQAGQAEARDLIGSLRPGPRAAHHHLHLRACAEALGAASREAELHLHKGATDRALALLREGLQQLAFAAGALPGFEVVAFSQSCCAGHASLKMTGGRSEG